MNNKIILSQEIENQATEFGIEPQKAANLIGNLPQIQSERTELEKQYDEVIKLDIEDIETSKLARELRIRIRDNRTKGILVWHKTTKDYFLKGGQFVDAIKRKEEAVNNRMEETLEQIEKHFEIKRLKEIDELRAKRFLEIQPYHQFATLSVDLGTISEDEYQKVYKGAKLQYEAKVEEDRIEQEKRLEAERLQKVYNENRASLIPYQEYIENFNMLDFHNITDVEISDFIQDAKDKKAKIAAEREEANRRAEEAERTMREERIKQEAERKKLEDKLRKEREEKERLEAEIKKRKQEEEKAKKAEEEKEKKLKNASDRVILLEIASRILNLKSSFPEVKGEEAKEILLETEAYLDKISNYVKSEAEALTK
jgi:hypothetical protein